MSVLAFLAEIGKSCARRRHRQPDDQREKIDQSRFDDGRSKPLR
jgi:hypothetical protein